MRVSNEPDEGGGISGAFGEMLRLQTDFHARLADETLRYLRRLQGAMGPAAPGTIVLPDDGAVVRAAGSPGDAATLRLEVENLQRVHCMITPHLTPLVGRAGATWFPEVAGSGSATLVPPDSLHVLELRLHLPDQLPDDVYSGALILQGFRDGAVPVEIRVGAPTQKPAPRPKSTRSAASATGASKVAAGRGGGRSGAAIGDSDATAGAAAREVEREPPAAADTTREKRARSSRAGAKEAGARKRSGSSSRSRRPSGEGEP